MVSNNDVTGSSRYAAVLSAARAAAGLGLRELARRAGTSHATLSQYERGSKVPSVEVFLRLLEATDHAVDFALRPRVRERNGLARGEELAQVLELAEQFPSNPSRMLQFPRFGS